MLSVQVLESMSEDFPILQLESHVPSLLLLLVFTLRTSLLPLR